MILKKFLFLSIMKERKDVDAYNLIHIRRDGLFWVCVNWKITPVDTFVFIQPTKTRCKWWYEIDQYLYSQIYVQISEMENEMKCFNQGENNFNTYIVNLPYESNGFEASYNEDYIWNIPHCYPDET